MGHLTRAALVAHNRSAITPVAYYYGPSVAAQDALEGKSVPEHTEWQQRIVRAVAAFRNIEHRTTEDAARMIRVRSLIFGCVVHAYREQQLVQQLVQQCGRCLSSA